MILFLAKLHFAYILFLFAVVAGEDAVGHMEMSGHRLVVGDALGVVALHDAFNLVGCLNGFLLHYLVVAYDVENHSRV